MAKAETKKALNSVTTSFEEILSEKTFEQAEVILKKFASKEHSERQELAHVNVDLVSLNEKLEKAQKTGNKIALQEDVSNFEARVVALTARIEAIVAKRDVFVSAFAADPYAALADASLASTRLDK